MANTAVLVQALAAHRRDLVRLLTQGSTTARQLDELVVANRPNLGCLVHDLADVNQNLGQGANLANLDTTLATNWVFFGDIEKVAPAGPAIALTSGDKARTDQEWLRTRLLLPPAQPSAIAYSPPSSLPVILPGAACDTEFGAGAGPVTQTGFRPAGPGGHVSSPAPAEAEVRGGGAAQADAAPAAARLPAPAGTGAALALVAGALGLGWLLTLGRRRGRGRSARPVRIRAGQEQPQ